MKKAKRAASKMTRSKRSKKPTITRAISKVTKSRGRAQKVFKKPFDIAQFKPSFANEKEAVEESKFTPTATTTATQPLASAEVASKVPYYVLPARYGDNRIILLPRDPWWIHTYWDVSEEKISSVISSIPLDDRQNLRWILRVYDVTGIMDFNGTNANSSFDIDINFGANNWYINVNQPERDWCVEIGLKNSIGKFFAVARSNIIKTPCFGISSLVDEEWVLPDDEYFKILGLYDLGKSSLQAKKKIEEIFKRQISSPLASWGVSSLFSERVPPKEKFFLEVWTELILYGRTEPDATVTVEGKKVDLRKDGTFTLRYALPEGDFKFNIATSKNKKHTLKKTLAVKRYNK